MRSSFAAILIAFGLLAGCGGAAAAPRAARPAAPTRPAPVGTRQDGLATYYADSLAGRPTASGEPYAPHLYTAAHRTLPFGTFVEVKRDNGKAIVVRVNDRGPFGDERRIIDLSRSAAEALGMMKAGVVPVTVTVVQEP